MVTKSLRMSIISSLNSLSDVKAIPLLLFSFSLSILSFSSCANPKLHNQKKRVLEFSIRVADLAEFLVD